MPTRPNTSSLNTPSAIIVAGIVIAIAIIIAFAGNGKTNQPITQNTDGRPTIGEAAKAVGLRANQVEACVENDEQLAVVEKHLADATDIGATGTPNAVIIGPDGQTFPVSGALPREAWEFIIDIMLGQSDESLPELEDDLSGNVDPVTNADHLRGNPEAPVIIVEYSDIDCPFCQRVHPILASIVEDRPDDVAWVYRHFPIPSLHPDAPAKAEAAECVAAQTDNETFWEYLDLLIEGKS
jgi:protein-disulfide isomerase